MKVRLKRPTRQDKKTGLYHCKIYKLIGANIARRVAKEEALKFNSHVYAYNPRTGKMLYLYTSKGELQDFTYQKRKSKKEKNETI